MTTTTRHTSSPITRTTSWAMYICRGCGTEIAYPQRFTKCPVCGIRLN